MSGLADTIARMSTHEAPEADMLPGLRAAVDDAKAKAAATRRRTAASWEPAAVDPVARVLVDIALAHLDRPFDYAVPTSMADSAVPGARASRSGSPARRCTASWWSAPVRPTTPAPSSRCAAW